MNESGVELFEPGEVDSEILGDLLLLDIARYLLEYNDDMTLAQELKWAGTRLYDKSNDALRQRQEQLGSPSRGDLPYDQDGKFEHTTFMDPAIRAVALRGLAAHIEYKHRPNGILPAYRPAIVLHNKLVTISLLPNRSAHISKFQDLHYGREKLVHGRIDNFHFGANSGGSIVIDTGNRLKRKRVVEDLIDTNDYKANVAIVFENSKK